MTITRQMAAPTKSQSINSRASTSIAHGRETRVVVAHTRTTERARPPTKCENRGSLDAFTFGDTASSGVACPLRNRSISLFAASPDDVRRPVHGQGSSIDTLTLTNKYISNTTARVWGKQVEW